MFSTVIGSMELIGSKKIVMVGSRWRTEEGNDCVVKKVSLWLEPGGGYILSVKTRLSFTFDFDAVDV